MKEIFRKFFALATSLICIMLLFCLNFGAIASVPTYFYALTASGILAGTFLPQTGFCLLLFSVPFFGNRPGTMAELLLTCLVSAFALPISLRLAIQKGSGLDSRGQVLYLFYVLAGIVSLLALPWHSMLAELHANLPQNSDIFLAAHYVDTELLRGEYSIWHSLKTVAFSIAVYHLAFYGYQQARANKRFVFSVAGSALAGLLVSLFVGLLDYYGAVNLRVFRGLDPVVNPGDVQFRLQSFFGHSGWFAEYVTLCIPTVIAILSFRFARWIKILAIILILLLGEFVLILTFQRGGWISYPITLLATWSAIYLLGGNDQQQEKQPFPQLFKKIAPKILISLPLTVLCSISLIMTLKYFHALPQFEGVSVDAYVSRFEDITKTSDRTQFMKAGLMLGSTSPLIGLGSESFSYWFKELFKIPSGMFYGTFDLPLYGSAHDVYAQTFSGKGILGLLLLVGLMLNFLTTSLQALRRDAGPNNADPLGARQSALAAGMLLAASCSFLIYGVVQEIFYIASLEVLVFCLMLVLDAPIDVPATKNFTRKVAVFFCLIVIVHCALVTVPQTEASTNLATGCSAPGSDNASWCSPRSTYVAHKDGSLRISFGNAFKRLLPATVQIVKVDAGNKSEDFELAFKPEVTEVLPFTVKRGDRLMFQTKAYFIPLLRGESKDRRILSFKIIE